ncbi:MAG: peptidase C39 family protein [Anaerolineales bacterium]|nr:peptidase C39 family protein [Anaerolineales bacterium]
MPDDWLKVPHIPQSADGRCLQACAGMILAYLESPVDEDELSNLFDATEYGVPSSRISRLEQWGFRVTYRTATLSEIRAWLAQEKPVIAFVNTRFLDYWTAVTPHAVVLLGISKGSVFLNDPAFSEAPQTCSLDAFLAAWVEMDEVIACIATV